MRIAVDSIGKRGRQVELRQTDDWVRQAAAEAFEAEPLAISGRFEIGVPRRSGEVEVQVTIAGRVVRSCDRCGEPTEIAVEGSHVLSYAPASTSTDEEVELERADLDLGWYMEGQLALDAILAEAIALELPDRILCQDTAACDERTRRLLDEESSESTGHPAFAALKNLH